MTCLLPMPEKRIFSGIQPTGNLHLGNYLGAIRNWVMLQDDFESIYCVVDLHAITVAQDPQQLRQSTREVAASLIAAGISTERSVLFNQSSVPQHSQLAWVFNCIARLGWLNRMTQFKEQAQVAAARDMHLHCAACASEYARGAGERTQFLCTSGTYRRLGPDGQAWP